LLSNLDLVTESFTSIAGKRDRSVLWISNTQTMPDRHRERVFDYLPLSHLRCSRVRALSQLRPSWLFTGRVWG
jgi:hypothetical protein